MATAMSSKAAVGSTFTPFRNAKQSRSANRTVVRAQQESQKQQAAPNDAFLKTIGAVTAATMAFMPFTGAAVADILPETAKSESARAQANKDTSNAPTLGEVGKSLGFGAKKAASSDAPDLQGAANKAQSKAKEAAGKAKAAVSTNPAGNVLSIGQLPNPADNVVGKAKAAGNKAKAAVAPNPLDTLKEKTKETGNKAASAVAPNPLGGAASKAKSKVKQAAVDNPAKEFARKSQAQAKKVQNKAPALAKKAKKEVSNPAKEFARKSQKAKANIANKTPLLAIDYSGLQQDVLFGFGKSKVEKKAEQAVDTAKDVASSGPSSFSIFDAKSVDDAKAKLKQNVDEAVSKKSDPAERVVSFGKPGESQEENAERIRREAENGPVTGGDARAPTN